MTFAKQAVFLLLLLAVSTYADHHIGDQEQLPDLKGDDDHADCENLNKTLHSKDLHKSFGDWVLVYRISEHGEDVVRNFSSSHMEVRLLDDNKTVSYKQWNKYTDGSCASYFVKTSLAEDRADLDRRTLPVNGHHLERNGELTWHNETAEFQFFPTCDNSLLTIYKGEGHHFLHIWRREGQHRNVTQLRENDDHHDRQAKCLGFSHEATFRYDGVAEPCSKETPKSFNEHLEKHDHHDHHDHHVHQGDNDQLGEEQ